MVGSIQTIKIPGVLHLADRASFNRPLLSIITRGPCRKVKSHILAKIFDRSDHTAHCAIGAVMQHGLFNPFTIKPAVAMCQQLFWYFTVFVPGMVHAKWFQYILGDILLVTDTCYLFDDVAQCSKTQVAIFIS